MANGLDKLPGHAYAPGMEPKFWDNIVVVGPDSIGNLPGLPVMIVGIVILMLCLSRVLAPRTRLKTTGTGILTPGQDAGFVTRRVKPGHAEVLAKTLMDSNFARDLRLSRSHGAEPDPQEQAD